MTGGRKRTRRVERWFGAAGRYLGLIGTALKLAQLAPAAAGVAVVVFSPSAWLSDTLRQWAFGGVVAGSAAGMVTLAAVGRRVVHRQRLGSRLLVAAFVVAAALRLQLAVVDLAFVGRWPLLMPLHDAFLGTDLGERLFNLAAAIGFGLTVFLATVGLPSYLRTRGGRARAPDAAPDAAPLLEALATLNDGIASLRRAHDEVREENQRLRDRLAALEATPAAGREAATEAPPDGPPEAATAPDAEVVPAPDAAARSRPPP
jgi:hypothetical protein